MLPQIQAPEVRSELDVWLRTVMPTIEHRLVPSLPVDDGKSTAESARQNRQREFELGRNCASQLLATFGSTCQVKVNKDRSPAWPPGMVGSISHSCNWTWVAVSRETEIASIGIDTERIVCHETRCEIETQIANDREWEIVSTIGLTKEQSFSLVFSAKEAFYKCWYPLSQEFFGFDQAVVDSANRECLTIRCLENNPNFGKPPATLNVHYRVTGKDVFTLTWMEQE